MATDAVAAFEESLSAIGVETIRTTVDGVTDALAGAITRPAVGTPLRLEGVTLEGTGVTVDPTTAELVDAATGVTAGLFGLADYGSVAIASSADGDELVSLLPGRQVTVVPASRVHPSMDAAFAWLAEAFERGTDSLVFVTGSSATADMGAPVEGVHGPGEVCVIVVEDR